MATALAAAAMIGGTALSAYSTIQGGKEAAEQGKLQQQQFEAEAKAELMQGSEAAFLKRKEAKRMTASQIAAISASGSGFVGSNLVVLAESARNAELDAGMIERNSQVNAQSLKVRGELARYEGQLARRNARMRAFANTLSTVGQAYLLYNTPKPKTAPSTPTYSQPLYRNA
jgi:hypothetical protein